jgi:DUF2075 family protein
MFRWYAINTYSGHENKVKTNLEHRIDSMAQQQLISGTAVVLVACLITGLYLYANDRLWEIVVKHVLLR